tara:strand:+ start:162 stop:857 length:696 start_codon:yes stop_codon:yes gene_type:complete
MGLVHSPRIVTDGLVLCLDAANSRSYPGTGATWTDLKGGNNGTLENGPTFDANNGGSIVFDGSDDNVEIPHNTNQNLSASNGHSVSVWCKWISGNAHQDIVSKDSESGTGREWLITKSNSSNKFRYHVWNSSNSATYQNANYIAVSNQWVNLTQVWNGSLLSFYVNGSLDSTISASITPKNSTTIMRIGGGSDSGSALHFNGSVSSVLLYQKALTADEILQNYLATKGRYE